jgi:hypothetical protein
MAATWLQPSSREVKFGYNVNPMYDGLVPTGSPATWDVVAGTLVIDLRQQNRMGLFFEER